MGLLLSMLASFAETMQKFCCKVWLVYQPRQRTPMLRSGHKKMFAQGVLVTAFALLCFFVLNVGLTSICMAHGVSVIGCEMLNG
ncbi:MAG: hypothetical protein CMF60_05495 [Magnetococcales bacterium]|nr:hypothetical protein [Magnetococcales bacterium]|tara:strand:- start:2224 stop:2475 length:252 start_codon:yes stop_codon:yes gene_type:complete